MNKCIKKKLLVVFYGRCLKQCLTLYSQKQKVRCLQIVTALIRMEQTPWFLCLVHQTLLHISLRKKKNKKKTQDTHKLTAGADGEPRPLMSPADEPAQIQTWNRAQLKLRKVCLEWKETKINTKTFCDQRNVAQLVKWLNVTQKVHFALRLDPVYENIKEVGNNVRVYWLNTQ